MAISSNLYYVHTTLCVGWHYYGFIHVPVNVNVDYEMLIHSILTNTSLRSAPELTPPADKLKPDTFKDIPIMIGVNEKNILEPVMETSPKEATPPQRLVTPIEPVTKPLGAETNSLEASGSEVTGGTEGVVKREMVEEKKKSRRIRTKSKVETVL